MRRSVNLHSKQAAQLIADIKSGAVLKSASLRPVSVPEQCQSGNVEMSDRDGSGEEECKGVNGKDEGAESSPKAVVTGNLAYFVSVQLLSWVTMLTLSQLGCCHGYICTTLILHGDLVVRGTHNDESLHSCV